MMKMINRSVFMLKTALVSLVLGWSLSVFAEEEGMPAAEEAAAPMAESEQSQAVEAVEAAAPAAMPASYRCTHGDQVRVIEVAYLDPPATVPCEVRYSKETEEPGVTTTPWSASNKEGYCEEKAAQFAERQKGWGWDCN